MPLDLNPAFKKKILSSFIRNGCQRRLRLSLYSEEARIKLGMSPDQKARSLVGQVGAMGREWQDDKINELGQIFGPACIMASPSWPTSRANPHDFGAKLSELAPYQFIVEAEYTSDTEAFRQGMGLMALTDEFSRPLGLGKNQADLIQVLPPLCEAPASEPASYRQEVLPNGDLRPLAADDARLRLRVIDIKMASEPGANYFAEVVYYALTLTGWLHQYDHTGKFVVVAASAVWPGSYVDSQVTLVKRQLIAAGETVSLEILASALEEDLELAQFETFVAQLRRFFKDTLPRVLTTPWKQLSWFVNYSCQGCEFIGYPWLKDGVEDHHELWCWPEAKRTQHLSQVVGLSRGNARQLGVSTLAELAALPPDAPVFTKSPTLRTQSTRFPGRAAALLSGITGLLADAGSDALMPKWPDLRIYLFLDYDLASAVTVTFGIRARWLEPLPFGSSIPAADRQVQAWDDSTGDDEVFVVEARDLEREQQEFIKFLRALRKILNETIAADKRDIIAGRRDKPARPGKPAQQVRSTYQIFLWDEAQRRHLQRLVGRHLFAIITDPALRDLAWLFPPPELLAHPDQASTRSPFTMVSRVVQNTVAVPLPHHYTLFDVAQLYHPADYVPPVIHPLYREPLSDLIPGERIHELWNKKAGRLTEKQEIILRTTKFKLAALQVVSEKLRNDLQAELLPNILAAPELGPPPSRPMAGLPPFSQLLHEFTRLNAALQDLEGYTVRAMPPHEREARFRSAHLTVRLEGSARTAALEKLSAVAPRSLDGIADLLIYRLGDFSRELNARPGDIGYALSPRNNPGFLQQRPLPLVSPHYQIVGPGARITAYTVADAGLTAVTIEAIDRVHGFIALRPDTMTHLVAKCDSHSTPLTLEDARLVDLSSDVMLDKIEMDALSDKVKYTLRGIGYPESAYHSREMRLALGVPATRPPAFASPTPAAQFLWDGPSLAAASVTRNLPATRAVLEPVLHALEKPLNDSQWSAWSSALTHRLSLIWGPPGTGKSQTLRALIAGALLEANQRDVPLRLLVSATNYAALDNVLNGLTELLEKVMPTVPVDIVRVEGHDKPRSNKLPASILSLTPKTKKTSPEVLALQARLDTPHGLLIIGAIPHQIHNLAIAHHTKGGLSGEPREQATQRRWFDLVVIDEASQMDVAAATLVISKAADEGCYVLAGDDKQLPPIQQADAPKKLECHVGSVFEYTRYVQKVEPQPLNINYRSNRTLVEFTRRADYSDQLEAYSPDLRLDLPPLPLTAPADWPASLVWSAAWGQLLDPAYPATAFTYDDDTSGQANDFEADTVAAVLWLLKGRLKRQLLGERQLDGTDYAATVQAYDADGFWERAVGVVTPHKAQMSKIVARLQALFPHDNPEKVRAAVDTVERFQGQQRDVIIASFGIGDPDLIQAEDEFIFSLRRFNVLASRARAKLIVLAPQSLVDHLSNDARVLADSHLLKGYIESYCRTVAPLTLPHRTEAGAADPKAGYLRQHFEEPPSVV